MDADLIKKIKNEKYCLIIKLLLKNEFTNFKSEILSEKQKNEAVYVALKKHFRPEFLNRIDETVMFKSLGEEQIRDIVQVQLQIVIERLKAKKIQMEFSEGVCKALAVKGYDPIYGARPLKRVIQVDLLNPLSKEMISGNFKAGDSIKVDMVKNQILFTKK